MTSHDGYWFPCPIGVDQKIAELHADGTWSGSIEKLRQQMALGRGPIDTTSRSTSRILLWLVLREMERKA